MGSHPSCIVPLADAAGAGDGLVGGLSKHLAMELGRKPLDAMRWEELWDAALRIRSAFLRAGVPDAIAAEISQALADHIGDSAVAVRSSAPGEDSQQLSFAGLHESIVGVTGDRAVLDLPAATPEDVKVDLLSADTPRQLVGPPEFDRELA